MALIIEDGTAKADSNAYAILTTVDAYLAETGRVTTAWDALASDAAREERITQATWYLDAVYGGRFIGTKRTFEQSLEWPRISALTRDGFYLPSDAVPLQLIRAVSELANRAASVALMPDLQSGATKQSKVKVGPLEIAESFADPEDRNPIFGIVEGMLDVLTLSGGAVTLVRQ